MPRDGSGVYSLPAGTTASPNTTIESAKYNAFGADLVTDLNAARPITAGGTGAVSAALARTALAVPGLATENVFTKTQIWAKGADVASAAALPIIDDGNYFDVTGTTTVTSIATVGVGAVIKLHFDGALILTYNATSLILPGAANITTVAGDMAEFVSEGSGNWRCTSFTRGTDVPETRGTWTGALVCGTSGTITMGNATGRWIRRGGVVTISGVFDAASVSSPVGTLTLTGLPFAVADANANFVSFPLRITGFVGAVGVIWQAYAAKNTSAVILEYYAQSDGSIGTQPAAQVKAGTSFILGGSYMAV